MRKSDAPWRTALGAALFAWIFLVFLAGASDRVFVTLGISYYGQIWFYRIAVWVVPLVVLVVTKRTCEALVANEKLRDARNESRRSPGSARA